MSHASLTRATAAAPRRTATPLVPGGWELVRLVGEGEMARVYQARPTGGARSAPASYAIKLLKSPWDNDPRGLEMLAREARIARRVTEPHLMPILSANLDEPPYHVVMPLVEGRTLAALIASGERPAVPLALWVGRQIAEALAALDDAGWVHCDVKPGNILLSASGHATLFDLGLAQQRSQATSLAARPMAGTLAYMAPEQLVSALAGDARSDLYSLGVTLFEFLVGRLPFESGDAAQLAARHRQDLPADLRVLAPHLPTRVARLIRQLLAKEPLRRPQSPRELVGRLAALEIETFAERMPV